MQAIAMRPQSGKPTDNVADRQQRPHAKRITITHRIRSSTMQTLNRNRTLRAPNPSPQPGRTRRLTKTALALLAAATLLTGCSTAEQSSLIGAGIGALAGRAIGDSPKSAWIGAGVGSAVGYAVGNEIDKANAQPRRHVDYRYRPAYRGDDYPIYSTNQVQPRRHRVYRDAPAQPYHRTDRTTATTHDHSRAPDYDYPPYPTPY